MKNANNAPSRLSCSKCASACSASSRLSLLFSASELIASRAALGLESGASSGNSGRDMCSADASASRDRSAATSRKSRFDEAPVNEGECGTGEDDDNTVI